MSAPEDIFNGKPIGSKYDTERGEWLFSVVERCGVHRIAQTAVCLFRFTLIRTQR